MIRQVARQVYLFSTFQTLKSLNVLSKIWGGGGERETFLQGQFGFVFS